MITSLQRSPNRAVRPSDRFETNQVSHTYFEEKRRQIATLKTVKPPSVYRPPSQTLLHNICCLVYSMELGNWESSLPKYWYCSLVHNAVGKLDILEHLIPLHCSLLSITKPERVVWFFCSAQFELEIICAFRAARPLRSIQTPDCF